MRPQIRTKAPLFFSTPIYSLPFVMPWLFFSTHTLYFLLICQTHTKEIRAAKQLRYLIAEYIYTIAQ